MILVGVNVFMVPGFMAVVAATGLMAFTTLLWRFIKTRKQVCCDRTVQHTLAS